VRINTTRFGEIDVKESEWIVMKGSILGFEHLNRFVLLMHEENTPLCWLQSIEDPALAFVVVNPRIIKPGYNPVVYDGELEFLGIKNSEDIVLLVIVTVRSKPFRLTANLRAPILVNAGNRTANQVVLDEPDYPIQYDMLDHKTDFDKGFSDIGGGMGGLCKLPLTNAAM